MAPALPRPVAPDRSRSLQLDAFRGLAAVFMIVNHAGYELLGAAASSPGWQSWLVFVGSAAPALFFFATGVGTGFGAGGREAWASMLRKVVLLLAANLLMSWGGGGSLNFDFFGFAALSTFVLFLVRRAPRPVATAWLVLALVIFMRFGLAPLARGHIERNTFAAFVTGIEPCWFVSYPVGPWLAFPLMGFLLGRAWPAGGHGEQRVIAALGLVALGVSTFMAYRGAPVFRWASVSIAYFLSAIGIVALAWLAAGWLARARPPTAAALALRGPSSLLIVPLHYGALGLIRAAWPAPLDLAAWLVATTLLAAGVLLLSRAVVAWARSRQVPAMSSQSAYFLAVIILSGMARAFAPPLVRLEVCSLGEVVLGLLLLWPNKTSIGRPAVPIESTARQDG